MDIDLQDPFEVIFQMIDRYEKGGVVLNREITLEVNGVRVRVDVAADFNGEIILMEVKNGPFSRMTPNQRIVYP